MTPEELFEEWRNLIYFTIKKYYGSKDKMMWIGQFMGMDWNDLEQMGAEGLWIACKRYDDSRGVKFSTFAINYINLHIRGQMRETGYLIKFPQRMITEDRRKIQIKSAETVLASDYDDVKIIDLIEDETDYFSDVIGHLLTEQICFILSPAERIVLKLKVRGLEHDEIAKVINNDKNNVRTYFYRALQKIRNNMELVC